MTITTGTPQKTKLEMLKDAAGTLSGPLETELGRTWFPRLQRSKKYLEDHSEDWDQLRALYAKPYQEIEVALPDGGKIRVRIKLSIAWSMGKNHITDIYFRNPKPWIRSRRGREDHEFDHMINDVAEAIHEYADSEEVHRKCLITGLYQGAGISFWTFHQEGEAYSEEAADESGQESQKFRATKQCVVDQFIPLSRAWLDPDGREWDFSDSKYVGLLYTRSLQECWEDERHYTEEGRRMLVHAVSASSSNRRITGEMNARTSDETDPSFINVTVVELYDKTSLQVIHFPVVNGEIQKFELGIGDWPLGLKERKKYPVRLVGEDWNPPNTEDTDGIYPTPLLRHAKGLIEDIIRLYELFFTAASKVVDKFVTWEGLLKADDFVEFMSTDADDIISLKPDSAKQIFGLNGLPHPNQVLQRLDRGGEKLAQAIQFANMIEAAKRELYEIFGQGPADRGGVAPGTTATEIAKMTMAKDQRTQDAREQIGKAFDDETEIAFLLTENYQTLPIPYQMTTGAFNERRWSEFEVELLYGMDLVFSHVTDSTRPRNKVQDRAERSDFMAKSLPFLTSKRQIQRLAAWAMVPYEYEGDLRELFEDPSPDIAKELLAMQIAIQDGQLDPANPEVAAQMMALQTELIQSVLTESDLEDVATRQGGAASSGARGAAPKSKTPGQLAAAGAAAGMTNVG